MISQLELSVLKVLISDRKLALEFVFNGGDSKYFSPSIWNVANIILNYIKNYREIPTLRILTERLNKSENQKLKEHIIDVWQQLQQLDYDIKEYKYDLEKLKKIYINQQITHAREVLSKLDQDNPDINKAVAEMQKTVQSVKNTVSYKSSNKVSLKDYLPEFVQEFNLKKNNPEIENRIKTGYSFFDYATNGVGDGDLIIIAGESGFGKSLVLNNIGIQVWMQKNTLTQTEPFQDGKNVLYFSLEMPLKNCFNRLLARLAEVPARKIKNASLNREEYNRVKQALDFINKYPYQFEIIDLPEANANDIENIYNNISYQPDSLIIDYLGIMRQNDSKTEEQDWLRQSTIAYELRAISRKYQIPVFSAVQLNRKSNTKDPAENIGLQRLARSGGIATHCTTIVQIESRQNEAFHSDMVLHVIKCRDGINGVKGRLIKKLSCSTLLDIPLEQVQQQEENQIQFTDYNTDDISEQVEDLDLEI